MEQEQNPQNEIMSVQIQADPNHICIVRSAARTTFEQLAMEQNLIDKIILAIDEAYTNVIRHSYDGPCTKPIILKAITSQSNNNQILLTIIIQDQGKQVDPSVIKSRDLDEIRPGGLGVHIIHSVMDQVEYSQRKEGGMQLKMTKTFKPEPEANR